MSKGDEMSSPASSKDKTEGPYLTTEEYAFRSQSLLSITFSWRVHQPKSLLLSCGLKVGRMGAPWGAERQHPAISVGSVEWGDSHWVYDVSLCVPFTDGPETSSWKIPLRLAWCSCYTLSAVTSSCSRIFPCRVFHLLTCLL